MNLRFDFSPYLSSPWVWAMLACAVGILALAFFGRARDFYWRAGLAVVLVFIMLNPIALQEVRQALPSKLVVVLDDSLSQKVGDRNEIAQKALGQIESEVKKHSGMEMVLVKASDAPDAVKGEETQIFAALRQHLQHIPMGQVAGTVVITDGQVHDVPQELGIFEGMGPFHTILTGHKNEFDRKVKIVSAPKYALLNDDVTIRIKLETQGEDASGAIPVDVFQDGALSANHYMMPGEERDFTFTLRHPGQNIFEFKAQVGEGELTALNNDAPVIINAVRDRLKVLLVSGSPHMGERAWRNLLKSDPGIDLVHFTILRSPAARDPTPNYEMSLIAFPVNELFVQKITDFDLIIFDRYEQFNLLMPLYFANIRGFVRNGGAFLLAMGTNDANHGIFSTVMADTLPVAPRGDIIKHAYAPQMTDEGKRHPITADLARYKNWGNWYTQADVTAQSGNVLMSGQGKAPLLVVDKVEQGRVAVLATDNIWLWDKGGETAGPYTELLRNVSHWLMKEPELEDDFIKTQVEGRTITVSMRNISDTKKTVQMKKPSGAESEVLLEAAPEAAWASARIEADENGIYSFTNQTRQSFAVVGSAQTAEMADVVTTPEKMQAVADKTGGRVLWFDEHPRFELRELSQGSGTFSGQNWIGMKNKKAYQVTRVESREILNNALILLIIMISAIAVWRREGGRW